MFALPTGTDENLLWGAIAAVFTADVDTLAAHLGWERPRTVTAMKSLVAQDFVAPTAIPGDVYVNPNLPRSDVTVEDLGATSRPFRAQYPGVCAWSGDRINVGDEIRMVEGLNRLNERKCARLPILCKWLAFNWDAERWQESPEETLALVDRTGDVRVWDRPRTTGTSIRRRSDGRYDVSGCTRPKTRAQVLATTLRDARVYRVCLKEETANGIDVRCPIRFAVKARE